MNLTRKAMKDIHYKDKFNELNYIYQYYIDVFQQISVIFPYFI